MPAAPDLFPLGIATGSAHCNRAAERADFRSASPPGPRIATFIRNASERRWRRPVAEDAVDRILAVTARHPYYVNALCSRLWGERRPPAVAAVQTVWSRIVDEDKRVVAGRIVRLAPSRRAMLKAIARTDGGVEHPASLQFLSPLRLPTSTGNRAKEVLEQDDLIRQEDDGRWTLVDPVMSAYLRTL